MKGATGRRDSSGKPKRHIWLLALAVICTWAATLATASDFDAALFRKPPDSARMTVYWIWPGPSVDKEGINRDLENMKAAGIGGAVVLPIYPILVDDPARSIRNLSFLSPQFLQLLHYAVQQAHEFGLTLAVTLGTGWPYGGPSVRPEESARKILMVDLPVDHETKQIQVPVLQPGEAIGGCV